MDCIVCLLRIGLMEIGKWREGETERRRDREMSSEWWGVARLMEIDGD